MLFRKVGAAKEEGRLKEDSLSETLRVLEETAAGGLGQPVPANKKKKTKKTNTGKHYTKEGASGQSTEKHRGTHERSKQ